MSPSSKRSPSQTKIENAYIEELFTISEDGGKTYDLHQRIRTLRILTFALILQGNLVLFLEVAVYSKVYFRIQRRYLSSFWDLIVPGTAIFPRGMSYGAHSTKFTEKTKDRKVQGNERSFIFYQKKSDWLFV